MTASRFVSTSFLSVLGLSVLVYALAHGSYQLDVAVRVMIAAFVAMGLRMLVGLAGQLSIGHAGFFAIGAYGSAILATRFSITPLLGICVAAAASALIAAGLGWTVLRLKGLYLAMATLGFGTIVFVMINTESAWTGGPDGMPVPPLSVFGMTLSTREGWFVVASAMLLIAVLISENLQRSAFGHALQAMEASEAAATSCGIDVTRLKVKVFALSAAMASLGGSALAHYAGYVTPQISSFTVSVEFLAMVIIGGSLSVLGPLLGALVITVLPIALGSAPEGVETMIFGATLVAVLIAMPHGLESRIRELLAGRNRS